jgi:hypothetical protein
MTSLFTNTKDFSKFNDISNKNELIWFKVKNKKETESTLEGKFIKNIK